MDFVGVVEVDFILVVDGHVPGISKLAATEKRLTKGWDNVNHVGWRSYVVQRFCKFGCLGCATCE